MNERTYKTRTGFLLPIFLDSLFLLVLLIISLFNRAFPAEPVILFLIFIVAFYMFLASIRRRTTIQEEGIRIRKFLREKRLRWEDITNVDVMTLRKKAYLLLTTTKGFHTLANSHENFTALMEDIVKHVDKKIVEESVQTIIKNPVKRISDIVSAWVICIILFGAVALKII